MLLLRDVNKYEKHNHDSAIFRWFVANPHHFKNRLIGQGVTKSRTMTMRTGPIRKVGLATGAIDGRSIAELYRIRDPKPGSAHTTHDYLQGMSGSTLDYCNWVCYITKGNIEKTMRLFQVNFAGWHTVAPDGWAHTQHESITAMLDMYFRARLNDDIMTPIKSIKDAQDMASTINHARTYIEKSRTPGAPGDPLTYARQVDRYGIPADPLEADDL